jgi:membrane protein
MIGGFKDRAQGWLRQVRDRVPGLRVIVRAAQNYIRHQSANQAGSVAFSSVLAMFPLLIFVSAAAAFVGQPGAAAELASRIMEFAPPVVADALKPAIDQVLGQRSRALLTIGVVATIWTASSGTQAIRTALNRAYGVEQGLSFWKARIKVTLFTVIGTVGTIFVFSSVVMLPYIWVLLEKAAGVGAEALWLRTGVRYGLAFFVLVLLYTALYGWLPDIHQRLRTVLPGRAGRRADVARGCGNPVLHAEQRGPSDAGLWRLRRTRCDPRLPLSERRQPDLRGRDQRRATRRHRGGRSLIGKRCKATGPDLRLRRPRARPCAET